MSASERDKQTSSSCFRCLPFSSSVTLIPCMIIGADIDSGCDSLKQAHMYRARFAVSATCRCQHSIDNSSEAGVAPEVDKGRSRASQR